MSRDDNVEVVEDFDACYRISATRDSRYDGVFFTAVTSTRIYCRPSCAARMPKRENVRFYRTAEAAEAAGFRACKRCRPGAPRDSPDWNPRATLVERAQRLIAEGAPGQVGVARLASELGFSDRHLRRLVSEATGQPPVRLVVAERVRRARMLIESTSAPFGHVAFAAGFRSVRQFNDTIKRAFGVTPTELRRRAANRDDLRQTISDRRRSASATARGSW